MCKFNKSPVTTIPDWVPPEKKAAWIALSEEERKTITAQHKRIWEGDGEGLFTKYDLVKDLTPDGHIAKLTENS